MHLCPPVKVDVAVFGGGAAGLWLLDELRRRGYSALLLESQSLGAGQTIASQGIIHGGLKYSLQGLLHKSARAVRDMPALWRSCLRAENQPDLSDTRVRSESCHLWRTPTLRGRLALAAARAGLSVTPHRLQPDQWPQPLRQATDVFRLDEQVIDPASFLAGLFQANRDLVLHISPQGTDFDLRGPGHVEAVCLRNDANSDRLSLRPRFVVLTAGRGNGELRGAVGLPSQVMQLRPLHMVVARGPLPILNGHCIDGARTRITVTTARDPDNRVIWQIGGQLAEDGVPMDPRDLVEHARREVAQCLPALNLENTQWTTYRVDRAEATTTTGLRPDTESVLQEGNVVTAWPTKMVLVPMLVRRVLDLLGPPADPPSGAEPCAAWPRPKVARPPWENSVEWCPSP